MKKALAVLIALTLVFVMAAACAEGGGGGSGNLTVGFSQIGSESDWRIGNTVSVSNAIEGAGWDLLFDDANQQQENQIAALRNFITQGVDYIVFGPIVETGWDAVLQEVKDAGIPLIMIDRTINMPNQENFYVSWITNNFEEEGVAAAEWLIAYLEHEGRMGEDINIVELQGTVGSGPQIYRMQGFHATVGRHSNLRISQTETGNFETEEGKRVMETFLQVAASNGETIDVVFAHNDGMALGAIQAIREAGLNPGVDIIIVGIDAVKAAFEAIIAGDMNATVECSPLLGPLVVEVIQDLEAGRTPPKTIINPRGTFDMSLYQVFPDRFTSAAAEVGNRVY
ncbi:MAG: ABC transporter substrate-binding protein [Oscillospiraceae bacterium]|nr:ABC transporter substrate-binding protein [Oscillospiraceae bacterium]